MKTITSTAIICLTLLCFSGSYSQTQKADSLKTLLSSKKAGDFQRLKWLGQLVFALPASDPEYAKWNEQRYAIIKKHQSDDLPANTRKELDFQLAEYYAGKGHMFQTSDRKQGLALSEKALAIYKKYGAGTEYHNELINLARDKADTGDINGATESVFEALKYFEKEKDNWGLAQSYRFLGELYANQRDMDKSVDAFKKSLVALETFPDTEKLDAKVMMLANLGTTHLSLKKFKEADAYFEKAQAKVGQLNDKFTEAMIYSRRGSANRALKKYDAAKAFFLKALSISDNVLTKAITYLELSKIYMDQKQFSEAEKNAGISMKLIAEAKYPALYEMAYPTLQKIYEGKGDYKSALRYYKLYIDLMKAKNEEGSKVALEQQQIKYEYEKKELQQKLARQKEVAVLQQAAQRKDFFLYGAIGLALVLVIGIFFLLKFFRQKQIINTSKSNELQRKLLLTQMNPHFIFNSVDNIQSLIHAQKDEQAIDYLTKFSKLTRQVLENSAQNHITLEEEIQMSTNYLSIQQLLYDNNFEYSISAHGIDTEAILIPPMLTQPFLENAVKHGLRNTRNGGRIHVRFSLENATLYFEVTDNGSGIESRTETSHKSLATQIVTERLKHNPKRKHINVDTSNLIDSGKVAGAKTTFEIPYLYDN